MTIVEKIDTLHARLQRAREIVKDGAIWPIHRDEERRFVAKSHGDRKGENGLPKLYLVGPESCTCADYRRLREHNGGWCKHRLARELVLQAGDDAEGREQAPAKDPAPDNQTVAPQPTSNKERFERAQAQADAGQHEAEATVGSV